MTLENIIKFIREKWPNIVFFGLLLAALSFFFLTVSQKNYKTNIDLLITQNQNGYSDYYALSKSADYLSSVMIEAIYSEKFLEEINNSGVNTSSFLPENKIDRLKEWKKTILVSKSANLGIVNVEIYSNNQNLSKDIANAITEVLTNRYFIFLGKGQDLDVRLLNGPLIEKNPTLSQIISIPLAGFIIGSFLFVFIGILWQTRKKTRFSFHENTGIISQKDLSETESVDYWAEKIEEDR